MWGGYLTQRVRGDLCGEDGERQIKGSEVEVWGRFAWGRWKEVDKWTLGGNLGKLEQIRAFIGKDQMERNITVQVSLL